MSWNQIAPPVLVSKDMRQFQALKLRAQGLTYHEIAEKLAVHTNTAAKYVREALSDLREDATEATQELRELEELRLDRMLASVSEAAFSGDLKAIETVLKLMERRAKLRGTDAPDRSMNVSLVGRTQAELEDEARRMGLPIHTPPLTSQLPGLPCPNYSDPSKSPEPLPSGPESPDCSVTLDTSSLTLALPLDPSERLPSPGNGTSPAATLPALMSWPGFDLRGTDPNLSGIPCPVVMTKPVASDELSISSSGILESPST